MANQKRFSEKDLNLKKNISTVLYKYFGLTTIFHEVYIGIHKRKRYWVRDLTREQYDSNDFHIHHPDMLVTNHSPPIIIEIDGDWHFLSRKGPKQTNERNQHYELGGIKLVWLTDKDADNNDTVLAGILAEKLLRFGIRQKTK